MFGFEMLGIATAKPWLPTLPKPNHWKSEYNGVHFAQSIWNEKQTKSMLFSLTVIQPMAWIEDSVCYSYGYLNTRPQWGSKSEPLNPNDIQIPNFLKFGFWMIWPNHSKTKPFKIWTNYLKSEQTIEIRKNWWRFDPNHSKTKLHSKYMGITIQISNRFGFPHCMCLL